MKKCNKLKEFLLSERHKSDRQYMMVHIHSCPTCRVGFHDWQQVKNKITDWSQSLKIPTISRSRQIALLWAVKNRSSRQRPRPLKLVLALGAAAACALAVGFFSVQTADEITDVQTYVQTTNLHTHQDAPTALLKIAVIPEIKPLLIHEGTILSGAQANETLLAVPGSGRLLVSVGQDLLGLRSKSRIVTSQSANNTLWISLTSGQIAIQAAKRDPGEKLVVRAGRYLVEVVGTRFMVSLLKGESIRVAVQEGEVAISASDGRNISVLGGQEIELSSTGEFVRMKLRESHLKAISARLNISVEPDMIARSDDRKAERTSKTKPSIKEIKLVPCNPKSATPNTSLRKDEKPSYSAALVRSLILAGEFDQAARVLEAHLDSSPGDAEAWIQLGRSQRKAGKWQVAAESFEQAIRCGSARHSDQARFMAGVVYQEHLDRQKDVARMFSEYATSTSTSKPLEADALLRLAKAQLKMGDSSNAHQTLQTIQIDFAGTTTALAAEKLLGSGQEK